MIQSLIERSAHQWKQVEGSPSTNLLKLGILREIHRAVHASKSTMLAKGKREEAKTLGFQETHLEELRASSRLDEPLVELLSREEPVRKRTRILPEALFNFIPKDKLERYDRAWEKSMAAEACSIGWRFWTLDAWVEIPSIEEWDRHLSEKLWPHGLVLFVESAGFMESRTDNPDNALWHGNWITVLDPRFDTPSTLTPDIDRWPGTTITVPTPAHWKSVFTPKRY